MPQQHKCENVVRNFIMNILPLKYSFKFAFFLTSLFLGCGPTTPTRPTAKIKPPERNKVQFDTSKVTIISFDESESHPFDSNYRQATLTQADLNQVDTLLIKCVTEYNRSLEQGYKRFSIDLIKNNYKRQLVAVTNNKGEKEVWVNCFCRASSYKWKSQIMLVEDGGNCYFNFKINLSSKRVYDLAVNGLA